MVSSMARVRRKICFCTSCGKQNHSRHKECKYCKKDLHQKNHLLRDYMVDNIKDDLKDKVTDKFYSIIKNYLLSHIYGSILVATVVITSASVIFNNVTNKVEIKKIKTRPVVVASSLNICENSIHPKLLCNDSFGFNDNNMCVKITAVDAKKEIVCSTGYHLSDSKCISDATYAKTTEFVCQKPTEMPDFLSSWDNYIRVYESNGECLLESCLTDGWDENGVCQAGGSEPIDYTEVTTCSEGSLINGECHKTKSSTTEYTCEEGTLDGKKCNIESEEEPIYECDEGYEYNKNCNACVEAE